MKKCELLSPEKRSFPLRRVGIQSTLVGGVARVVLTQVFDCGEDTNASPANEDNIDALSSVGLKSVFGRGKWCFILPLDGFLQLDELLVECNSVECDTELIEIPFEDKDPMSSSANSLPHKQFKFYKSLLEKDAEAKEAAKNLKDPFYGQQEEDRQKPAIDASTLAMYKSCSEFAHWWGEETMKKESSEICISYIPISRNTSVAIIKTTLVHALYRANEVAMYHFPLTSLSKLSPSWFDTESPNIMPLEMVVDVKLRGLLDENCRPRSFSHDVFSLCMDSQGRHMVQLSLCPDEDIPNESQNDIELIQQKSALKEAMRAVDRDFVLVVPMKKGIRKEVLVPSPGVASFILLIVFTIAYIVYEAKYRVATPI